MSFPASVSATMVYLCTCDVTGNLQRNSWRASVKQQFLLRSCEIVLTDSTAACRGLRVCRVTFCELSERSARLVARASHARNLPPKAPPPLTHVAASAVASPSALVPASLPATTDHHVPGSRSASSPLVMAALTIVRASARGVSPSIPRSLPVTSSPPSSLSSSSSLVPLPTPSSLVFTSTGLSGSMSDVT